MATEAARAEGIQGLGKITGQQAATREKAEAVANQIAKDAGDAKGPFEPEPTAPTPEPKPNPDNPPAETPEATPLPPDGAPPSPANNRPAEPGEKPLKQAVENQKGAEGNLQQ